MALRSTSFCKSAVEGVKVATLNFLRFGVLHGVVAALMFFVTIFVTALVVVTGFFMLREFRDEGEPSKDYASYIGPLVVICLIGYIVSTLFSHIWEASADAILHCYCVDEQIQAEYGRAAKFAKKKLRELINDRAKRRGTEVIANK